MTNLNALRHVHIHPMFWFLIGVGVLTGSLLQLFIVFSIVLFHEFGHYGMARYFNWRIRSVMIWPFGGVLETDEFHTRPVKEEVLVIIAGPLQHVWILLFILFAQSTGFLSSGVIELLALYNALIFCFNILPIWPLDGGKLLFLLLSMHLPFVKAQERFLMLSLIFLLVSIACVLYFFPFSLSTIMLACFLLWENRIEWKQKRYAFLRYLMRRQQESLEHVNKIRAIHVGEDMPVMDIFQQFKRGTHHQICVTLHNQRRALIDEGECLYYYFTLKQTRARAKEMVEWFAT